MFCISTAIGVKCDANIEIFFFAARALLRKKTFFFALFWAT